MALFRAALLLFAALAAAPTHAQTPTGTGTSTPPATATPPATEYYSSYGSTPFSMPTGNLQFIDNSELKPYPTGAGTAPTAEDVINYQGCGGVGQADYTSALYNMPEVFDKFKRDVNSELAKQILTYNYSLPQTAALFDTLNTYGNARYQQFQQACKLDSLKQDAKNQYVASCVKERFPERLTIVRQALQNAKNATSTTTPPATGTGTISAPNPISDPTANEDFVNAQAYAQAWELCTLQYSTDSKALEARKTSNQKFIEAIRGGENVNAALKPLLCPAGAGAAASGCWQNLLLPQVRLCNGADLSAGCAPGTDYGVKEAPLSITTFFDLLRFSMQNIAVPKLIQSLEEDLKSSHIDNDTLASAARDAVLDLKFTNATASTAPTDESIKYFQNTYLNCKVSDIAYPTNKLRKIIKDMLSNSGNSGTGGAPSNFEASKSIANSDYQNLISSNVTLDTGFDADKQALSGLVESSLGCTVNQTIPIFDPNIIASLQNQCEKDDRSAFYTMASYDVSLAATRDVYRFVNLRLKQVYARLLSEKGAGVPQPTGATEVTDSPELRQRLANIVKEVMIPAVESQLARLDQIENTRGSFAQKVQKIYTDKTGCVFNSATKLAN